MGKKKEQLNVRSDQSLRDALDQVAAKLGGPWTRSSVARKLLDSALADGVEMAVQRIRWHERAEAGDPPPTQELAFEVTTAIVDLLRQWFASGGGDIEAFARALADARAAHEISKAQTREPGDTADHEQKEAR